MDKMLRKLLLFLIISKLGYTINRVFVYEKKKKKKTILGFKNNNTIIIIIIDFIYRG